MRVLSLSTLYPSAAAPNFGRFVELSLNAANVTGEVEIVRISPNGLPPWPASRFLSAYREKAGLPREDIWGGKAVLRPRFTLLPGMAPARNAAAIAKALLPLAHKLHAEKPFDLIDAQFFWPDGPAAMQIAGALGLPFSIKARGADIHYWTTISGCREKIIEAAQKAAGLLAVSETIKADIAALGVDAGKISVHRTGIDRSLFTVAAKPRDELRERLPIPADKSLLVSVGALIPRKGQAFAIRALAQLPDTRLALIGAGEDRAALEKLAHETGVSERVHFLGSLPHAEIANYLQAADVAVLPSASEGLANAWIEALACGTPLIITDAGGAREVLRSSDAGRIVERDASAIAAAIRELLASPTQREVVAAQVTDYSWQANGAALVAHWRRLLGPAA
ncbi:MAG: glycosyltransferase [Sphingomonadales bacterium]|jgi:teichuronic acid biosynthesis glycosyltransferase TuaC|nr:glycosyltransferase [Sphingomonadales bacterium]MBK9003114.1 glycosyltransferase [Sphingomonadales bacterium]MBK9268362.1 glycosyltransferase [Sphingomonadales bacterium]MBP6435211.1 glycosyltransferase [Sphingorhabdus sp.]